MSKKKPLSETNPYLRDKEQRKKLIDESVRTSCAVEGISVSKYWRFIMSLFKSKRGDND